MNDQATDWELGLLQRARREPDAARELYRAFLGPVYGYVFYRVGHQQDAERVVNEIFLCLAAEQRRFEYRGPGSLTTWVFGLAYEQVQLFYQNNRSLTDQLDLKALLNVHDEQVLVDGPGAQPLTVDQLRRLINRLPHLQQEVLTLRFFGRLSRPAIAEVVGIPETDVAAELCTAVLGLYRRAQTPVQHTSA